MILDTKKIFDTSLLLSARLNSFWVPVAVMYGSAFFFTPPPQRQVSFQTWLFMYGCTWPFLESLCLLWGQAVGQTCTLKTLPWRKSSSRLILLHSFITLHHGWNPLATECYFSLYNTHSCLTYKHGQVLRCSSTQKLSQPSDESTHNRYKKVKHGKRTTFWLSVFAYWDILSAIISRGVLYYSLCIVQMSVLSSLFFKMVWMSLPISSRTQWIQTGHVVP